MTADFVVDCSVALTWYFEDEKNPYADAILDSLQSPKAIVPDIFFIEATNSFLTALRRNRITSVQAEKSLATLNALPIVIDHGCSRGFLFDVFALARTHSLSAYDAAYLELAYRESLPLATLDTALIKAAKSARIKLVL